jgi:fructoselysine transporter
MSEKPIRQLGFVQTAALVIGVVIGSGVFINLPIVARIAGSPWAAAGVWLLGGVVWIPQALILAEMGTAYPNQGGPYYYIHKAGSPFLGFLYTWTAFLTSDTPTLTIVGLAAAAAAAFFAPSLADPLYARLFATLLIVAFAALQYRSVKLGGHVQVGLTIFKLLPLFAVVVIGAFFLGSGNLAAEPIFESEAAADPFYIITAGMAATLWAYAGFLNILYMAGEVKEPDKNLPRALVGSIFFVMIAYVLINLGTAAIVPFDELIAVGADEFVNPFLYLDFFAEYAGGVFYFVVFVSMLGVLNACMATQPRLEYAMARDKLFFESFGKLHPRYLTPHYSIVVQAGFAVVLFLIGDIDDLLGYFTLSYVLQNALVYGAIFWLRKREDYKPTYKARWWGAMATASIAVQLYIAYGAFVAYPTGGALAAGGLIASGAPIYYFFKKRKDRAAHAS